LKTSAAASALAASVVQPDAAAVIGDTDRAYWTHTLTRIADPVLLALKERKLKATMPVEAPHGNVADRRQFTHLEALGRLLSGIAPWLELGRESGESSGSEGALRARYAELAREAISASVDPSSPDYMNFNQGSQPVVDAAFLALAVLRAPNELWTKLPAKTKQQLITALKSSRVIRPGFSNWLLFSGTIEAFFAFAGEDWDPMRVDYAVRQINEWYKGDGTYGDGPELHWDYYNSYVIHPMLLQVLESVSKSSKGWDSFYPPALARAKRYAAIQERLIGPDGAFPPFGRSLAYRFGAFQLLSLMALRHQLPQGVSPEQVRAGLTAVIRKMTEAPGTFDANGWLTVGFCGHQPGIAEAYISTGSLYLCTAALLPLGLPDSDPFWSRPAQDWTARKAWSGESVSADHALPASIGG